MVLVHDTSSQCALQMYEVSLKYLNGYQVIEQHDFVTDRQTDIQIDGQTQGEKQYVSRPCRGGDIILNKCAMDL